ncbi:MAG TPA: Cyclin D1-binding domain-containing protein [Candidatus Saccharimonadales bacterium]|nr:Cyclin D1-binding domain-containing protein [Candidatus Saccharimonadales bacterium]
METSRAQPVVRARLAGPIDLSGEWIGHYPGHYDEVIRITQEGDDLQAVKITGDDFVPAGAVTWKANSRTGEGEGQIAEREFRNARFIPGRLTVLTPERIVFRWEQCGSVEYRKDD